MTVAGVLACGYAAVLLSVAVVLAVQWATGQGIVGNLKSNSSNRGVSFVVVLCAGGAALLVVGAVGAWRGRRGLLIIVPLATLIVIGCVGETIDIISGEPLADNLIGAGIIAAAAVPVVLLLLPRGRVPVGGSETAGTSSTHL
ncbi:hypothetical protein ITJ38_16685 [Agreia pratensis]|nr:hypothetical protein [Agreia pratensis]